MTFGQPLWFCALALLPLLLVFYVANERRRETLLRKLVAARLQNRLAGTVSIASRRVRFGLFLAGLACVITSLAQPQFGYSWEQTKRQGRDVLIAIDCSRSMLATDLAPSRLGRAKLAAQDFIGQLQGDRVGLIAFAGSAFLQAPLTIDYGAVLTSLNELDTDIIPRGGTNIAAAIKEAAEAFGKGESDNRCLVIFTDGEELYEDAVTGAAAQKDKIKIFTVGLGSTDGSLIPMPSRSGGTEFVKDENGQIVKSKLDEDRLRKIAEATGGFYVHLENGPAEMKQIVGTGLGQMKEQEIDARMSRRPIERYQWPLGAGLVLLLGSALISERKRTARRRVAMPVAALLAVLWITPTKVQAKNSGLEAYERKDYQGAMTEFDRQLKQRSDSEALQFNLGAAAYKTGDYGKALESFARAVTTTDPKLRTAAEYNIGNTLYQRGVAAGKKEDKVREWKDALQHYEQALNVEPQNKDAEHNRDVLSKMLEDLQKNPPPDQQKKDDKKDQKDQQKDKDKKDDQDQQKSGQDQQDQQQKGDKQDKSQDGQQGKDKDKDQQQGQSKDQKDQQSPGSQGDQSKDQPQQGKDEQGKEQPSKDPGKENEKGEPQDKDGKGDPKDGNPANQAADNGQNQPGQKDGQPAEQPPQTPEQAEKKRNGEIQAQNNPPPNDPQQEAAAEAQAAEEGRMTEAQAKALLESLKGEDDRVQLLRQGERRLARPLRDW